MQIIALAATPFLPLFAVSRLGYSDNNKYQRIEPRLPLWLAWFDTPDNSLRGDERWDREHTFGYLSMVGWLLRNRTYGFNWTVLSLPEGHPEAWQYKRNWKYLRVNLGWMLDNPEHGKLMFQLSIRKGKNENA